jgi:hypothetical protein
MLLTYYITIDQPPHLSMIKGDVSNICTRGPWDLFSIAQSSQINFNFGVGECSRYFCAVEIICFFPPFPTMQMKNT